MSNQNTIQPINFKLVFGINLKELYPPWYLHPAIKNLFYLIQETIKTQSNEEFDMENILSNKSTVRSLFNQQKLLKRRLMKGRNILDCDVSLTAVFWSLRNFLELLPIPIFPPQFDGHHWLNFSTKYYYEFLDTVRKGYCSHLIQEIVICELMNLPAHNLTFFIEFFDMLNNLVECSSQTEEVTQHAALVLARYYTHSLFIRSFPPENMSNLSRKLIGFVLFLIYFWRQLKPNLINKLFLVSKKKPNMLQYSRELYTEDMYADSSRYLTDKPTQTENIEEEIGEEGCVETNSNCTGNASSTDLDYNSIDSDSNTTNINTNSIVTDSNTEIILSSFSKDLNSNSEILSCSKDINSKIIDSSSKVVAINQIKGTFNTKRISEEYIPEKTDCNKERCTIKEYNIVTSTPYKIEDKYSILDQIQPDKIDNFFENIKKKNCYFRRTSYTQTTPENNEYSEIFKTPKSPKKTRKRKLKKPQIVVMKINYCKHDRHFHIKKTKTSKCNKINRYKNNNKQEILNESYEIASPNRFENTTFTPKPEGEYIFDSFIGKLHESCTSDVKTGNLNPFVANSCTDSCPSARSDVYNRIIKYGWTYNTNDNLEKNKCLGTPHDMPYQLCYDNDLSLENTFDASVVKKTNVVDSLKKVGSKFWFLKNWIPNKWSLTKSVSHEGLIQGRKGIKHRKSYNTI